MNRTIPELETLDNLVLIGFNPKYESPVLNARIGRAVRNGSLKVYKIGSAEDLTYPFTHLGTTTKCINDLLSDQGVLREVLQKGNNHIMISSLLQDELAEVDLIHKNLKKVLQNISLEFPESNNSLGVFQNYTGYTNGSEIGMNFLNVAEIGSKNVVINMGNDNKKFLNRLYSQEQKFTVYIGCHGDEGAKQADLVLPASAWTEQLGSYLNTEGRCQLGKKVTPPPALAKDQWEIFRVLSEELGFRLPYDSMEELRYRMAEISPCLLKSDFIESYSIYNKTGKIKDVQVQHVPSSIDNYYKTDSVSNASLVMAKCSSAFNREKMTNIYRDPIFK